MSEASDGGGEDNAVGEEETRAQKAERKAARKLRKADDVAREAPLTVQTSQEREGDGQSSGDGGGRGRNRERKAGGGGAGAGAPELTPEELELRRLYAGRIREARAAAGGGSPDPSGAVTISAEEMQLRKEYGGKLREMRGGAAVTVAAPALAAGGVASQPGASVKVAAAPAAAEMTPEQRKQAKREAARALREADMEPLPDSWRPPVPPSMGTTPVLLGGEAGALSAPVLRARAASPYRLVRAWLAARPGARGALAALAMFLFWELCRLWSGQTPAIGELLVDLAIWGLVGILAWQLFLRRERADA